MDTKLHIPVVIGTARDSRESAKVAAFVAETIAKHTDVTTEVVDVKGHVTAAVTIPPWGTGGANEVPTKWQEIVQKSAALILVVPEYNHSFPGELKLLLDSLYEDYAGMPVALVGVSAGTLGGARVIDHIKPVLIELQLVPIKSAVNVSRVAEAFDEAGVIIDTDTVKYTNKMLEELLTIAHLLAPLRK